MTTPVIGIHHVNRDTSSSPWWYARRASLPCEYPFVNTLFSYAVLDHLVRARERSRFARIPTAGTHTSTSPFSQVAAPGHPAYAGRKPRGLFIGKQHQVCCTLVETPRGPRWERARSRPAHCA